MEKDKSFTSTSILGLIYDWVGTWQTKDLSGEGKDWNQLIII